VTTRTHRRPPLAGLALLLLLASPALAQAQLSGPPLEAVLVQNAERLGLADTTVAEVKRLSNDYYQQMVQIQKDMTPAAKSFATLVQSDEPDEAEAMRLLEELGSYELAGRKVRLRAMLHFRSLLTKEQRAELLVIEREMMKAAHRGAPQGTAPGASGPAAATPTE